MDGISSLFCETLVSTNGIRVFGRFSTSLVKRAYPRDSLDYCETRCSLRLEQRRRRARTLYWGVGSGVIALFGRGTPKTSDVSRAERCPISEHSLAFRAKGVFSYGG